MDHSLHQLSQQLSQARNQAELSQHIAHAVEQNLQPAGLAVILRKGNALIVQHCRGLATPPGKRYAPDGTLAAWLAEQRGAVRLPPAHAALDPAEWAGAVLCVPLLTGEQLGGWLALGPPQAGGHYTPGQIDFLDALASQVSVALEVTRLMSELEHRVGQLSVLAETGQALSSSLRSEELLDIIYQQVNRLMDASNLYVALYDAESDTLSFPLAMQDGQRQAWPSRPMGPGLAEHVLHTRRPVLIQRELAIARLGLHVAGRPPRSWLGVPMIANQRAIGVIALQHFEHEEAYSEDDLDILNTIAAQAAVAIANAQLYEQTDQALARRVQELSVRNQQWDRILQLGSALKADLGLDQILYLVVQAVASSLGFNVAVLGLLHDSPTPHIRRVAAAGIPPDAWQPLRADLLPLDVLAQLMQDESRISHSYFISQSHARCAGRLTFHSPGQPARPSLQPASLAWQAGDVLLVPLTNTSGELQGLLSVEEPVDGLLPTRETVQVLEVFAHQASIAIENARLFQERARRIDELSRLYQASLALAFSTETEDVLKQVCALACELTSSDSVSIFSYDSQADLFTAAAALGDDLPDEQGSQIRPAGMTRRAVSERRSFVVADTRLQPDLNPFLQKTGICSIICMPLISKGQVMGVMYVNSNQPNAYTDDDVQLISSLAGQAAVAIENGRLFGRLAEGCDRLQAVLNSTREGMMMLDNSGRIIFTNTMFGELFHTSPASLTGRKLLEVMAEQRTPGDEMSDAMMDVIYETLSELADRNEAVHTSSITITHPPLFIERVSLPVLNEEGVAIGRLLTLRDITEEKKAEALREDLIRMIVHDLRGPMTSIQGGLQVLEYSLADEHDLQAVRIALSGSSRLLNLIDSLLDINKMEDGHMPLKRQELGWPAVVGEAADRLAALASSEQVGLHIQLADDLPPIYADEAMLLRVLTNLLDNAIKFSPAGTAVTLSVSVCNGDSGELETVCQVKDCGPGIAPEYHQRIFQKFFQVPDKTGRRKGSGLGLAFCRLAIEAHGGRIWVKSTPGQGSTFAFSLPARPGQDDP